VIVYILDTDIWSLYFKGDPVVRPRVDRQPKDEMALTVITVEENLSGWYTALRQARQRDQKALLYQNLTDTVTSLKDWQIVSFTEPALLRFEQLQKLRLNVGKKDLCIAAIALENNATVVTRNLRDFQRVPALTVENWAV
jgi:tRNA(fMet)-specific endonuclease VapC